MVTINAGGLAVLGSFSGSGSFTDPDPGPDSFTATVSYDMGGPTVPLAITNQTFTLSHNYSGLLGNHTVTVTVTDSEGMSGSATVTVNVLL